MTVDLSNRTIYDDGTVVFNRDGLVEILYQGIELDQCVCNDLEEVTQFKLANKICDTSFPEPKYQNNLEKPNINWTDHWFTPLDYLNIDIRTWCHDKCKNEEEHLRVDIEMDELEKRNMIPVLRHLIYCIDIWRQNNIFWGVGRGSSVSSFVLYLIGINRINPLKYNLDFTEWLK